jgi:hydroxybutyrate-dimer hydrolase
LEEIREAMSRTRALSLALALLGVAAAAAPAGAAEPAGAAPQGPPAFVVPGSLKVTAYDGETDDLLTAGLGAAGLGSATPPGFADPLNPTPAELRRLAIYSNYRALVDPTPAGGYGTFYGPGVGGGPERIAGKEYLAFDRGRDDRQNVTMLVQIPASFDPARACVVTGPSSGSRGVYGAIATSGEWGLKKGCAVAYTDKGTGVGAHDLGNDLVTLIDGPRVPAENAGRLSNFTAPISEAQRANFDAQFPHRFAFEHAHSELNPERDWGRHVLRSVEFALWALNREYRSSGRRLTYANTLVIASSVSNGGGASLRAAEMAPRGVIDGVAVSEPNVNPRYERRIAIRQGDGEPLTAHSRQLIDYTTLVNLYQGCANAALGYDGAVLGPLLAANQPLAANTCRSLRQAGLLRADEGPQQAAESQRIINAYGILPEQNFVQPSHWLFAVPQSISVTYANAYARASVLDRLCGYSFAATSAASPFQPVGLDPALNERLFGTGNGIPPTGGVQLVNDDSVGGPARNDVSVSATFNRQDQNVPGALCLRNLATGFEAPAGEALGGIARSASEEVRDGARQVLASGRLRGIPTVIVHGRADAVLAPNHTSRPYYALSRRVDGRESRIFYYEVLNAQHLDAFNAFPDLAARYVPLHVYFFRALDLMYDHLTRRTPLPPSQVVRTTPRGDAATALGPANLPPIARRPAAGDRIAFDGRTLTIPD